MNYKLPIIIREAETSDYNQINALFMELTEFEKLPDKMTNTEDRMIAEKDFFNCFVAETSEKEIIGYVTFFFCYFTWTGKSLYMDYLYVKPSFRGHGTGTSLIHKVISYAKETGCHKLHWQVSEWNSSAIDFYKNLGADINSTELNCDLIF